MHRILVTAFGPFLHWPTNASQQILAHWLADHPILSDVDLVTDVLPVDYLEAEPRVQGLAEGPIDFAIHLGQSGQIDWFALEMVALNLKHDPQTPTAPLDPAGPAAYISKLPLERWCDDLSARDIPAKVSFHAGTYLCNATYFWSTKAFLGRRLPDRALFVHVPLLKHLNKDDAQAVRCGAQMLTRLVQLVQDYLCDGTFRAI